MSATRRRTDRILIVLFFINFVVAVALCRVVQQANESVHELTELTCTTWVTENTDPPPQICEGYAQNTQGG